MEIVEKIYTAGLKLLEPLDAPTLYETIAHEAVKLVKGDEGRVLLRKNGEFTLAYGFPEIARNFKSRKKGFAYKSLTKNEAFIVDMAKHPKIHSHLSQRGVRSILFIPLSYKKEALGVLVVQSFEEKKFSRNELEILKLFGSLASLAIRRSQAYDEARRAIEIRDKFIPLAAHELRTPLTTISGYIQLLHNRMRDEESQEGKWIRELMIENRRLTHLVAEMLEVNRINAGRLELALQECRFSQIIEHARSQVEKDEAVSQKFVFLNQLKNGEDKIIADSDKLCKSIMSILDNSIKFSPPDGEIKITLKTTNTDLVLRIKDKGKGISEKDLTKIFESFYKGGFEEQKGAGLGLFLAKSIVEKHKGDIIVRSKEKKGTMVEIRLPRVNI